MPIPKNTAKTTQPKTTAPTNIFCFDDDDDDVVNSEIKNILVSGAKNMGSRKSETTLEPQRYEELRSQPSIHCKLDVQHYSVFRLKIAFCISI